MRYQLNNEEREIISIALKALAPYLDGSCPEYDLTTYTQDELIELADLYHLCGDCDDCGQTVPLILLDEGEFENCHTVGHVSDWYTSEGEICPDCDGRTCAQERKAKQSKPVDMQDVARALLGIPALIQSMK